MKSIGSLLFIFGLAAIIFGFMERVPKLLVWIYNWGESGAWIIKISLVVFGATIYYLGHKQQQAKPGQA